MIPYLRYPQKVSEQYQDDCTGEKFVRKRAVSQINRKQWGTKRNLDQFCVNFVLQDQTALELRIDCTMKKREFSNNIEKIDPRTEKYNLRPKF